MEGYYSDGITKYTDPLWVATCYDCNRSHWAVMKLHTCPDCGSINMLCTNPVVEQRLREKKAVNEELQYLIHI